MHDMFAVPFEEIAPIVGRSPAAARQLASRARRRVQGPGPAAGADIRRQREVADAFLAALRAGDFEGLLAVLDPDVVVRIDGAAAAAGAPVEIRGARAWAKGAVAFAKTARFSSPALVDGEVGIIAALHGRLFRVLRFTIADGKIAGVDIIADPARLSELDLAVIDV